MGRSRISQKLGMSRLKLADPRWPLLERLNQQAPQHSDPPFGMCPTSSSQLTWPQGLNHEVCYSHEHRDRPCRPDCRRRRRSVARRAVRLDAVVGLPVLSGQHLRLLQRVEDLLVQEFAAAPGFEALHIAVLPW